MLVLLIWSSCTILDLKSGNKNMTFKICITLNFKELFEREYHYRQKNGIYSMFDSWDILHCSKLAMIYISTKFMDDSTHTQKYRLRQKASSVEKHWSTLLISLLRKILSWICINEHLIHLMVFSHKILLPSTYPAHSWMSATRMSDLKFNFQCTQSALKMHKIFSIFLFLFFLLYISYFKNKESIY